MSYENKNVLKYVHAKPELGSELLMGLQNGP